MASRSGSWTRLCVASLACALPLWATAQSYEDGFGSLSGWTVWDGYAIQHPSDVANHAVVQSNGSQLSISFPGGYEHNMWWLEQAQVLRPYSGSGTYEIKVDSALDGSQQVGLIFQGNNPGTFMIFMLYATDQVRAYVERFSYVNGQQHKTTFSGGSIGRSVPDSGPYYVRVKVEDHPSPANRSWRFEWSANGSSWTQLVAGILEGSPSDQNVGSVESVGVFAGNNPYGYSAFDARVDYFRYHTPDLAPIPAPSNVVARAGDYRVDLWWDAVPDADSYAVYVGSSSGGPYTLLSAVLGTTFTDLSAPNGVRRNYVVTAFAGGREGDVSSEVSAVPHSQADLAALPTQGLTVAFAASELAYVLQNGDPVAQWPTALGMNAAAFGPPSRAPTFVANGLNGRAVVRFDGVDDFMTVSGPLANFTSGMSLYIVTRPTVIQHGSKLLLMGNGAGQDNIGLGRAGSSLGLQAFTDNGFGSVSWFDSAAGFADGEAALISLVQGGGSPGAQSSASVAKNGVVQHAQTLFVPPVKNRSVNYIGKSYWADGLFQGDIAEVLLYNRALSPAEQDAVKEYIADKYGLPMDGSTPPPEPVSAPASVSATAGDGNVALTWTAVQVTEGYRVYRKVGTGSWIQIADVGAPAHNDNTVVNGTTYAYAVTAYDHADESELSSTVFATPLGVPPPPPPPPPPPQGQIPTSGLILSLDAATAAADYANAQPVTVWRDASASGYDAVVGGGTPVLITNGLNGRPVVRFDGNDDFLVLPSGFQNFTAGITLYIVARPTVLQSGFKLLALGNGAAQQNIGLGRAGGTDGLQYWTDSSFGGVGWFNTGSALVSGEAALFSMRQGGGIADSFSYAEVSKNGIPLHGQPVYVPPVATRAVNYIGKSYWSEGIFQGDIAEILLYNRSLTDTEQQAVRDYIAEKYGF